MLASTSSYDSLNDVRIHRFNDALDKFLELIDERATNKNFQTALPHLYANLLDSARKQFVFHLKDAIKMEKDRLVDSYTLRDRLAELEYLTQEADRRNEEAIQRGVSTSTLYKDAWRSSMDLNTTLRAPEIPQRKQRLTDMEEEWEMLEQEIADERIKLQKSVELEESRRNAAKQALNSLDETLNGLQTSKNEEVRLHSTLDMLMQGLGPRGIA